MTRLLIQDDIINKMDVYVDYTVDNGSRFLPEVIIFDYGLELTADTVINGVRGREVITTTVDTSLRGYKGMEWMVEQLIAYIEHEEGIADE